MTFEIFLLTGVLLGGLSLISFLSALIDGRRPWVAALVLVIAAGLIFLAARRRPGGLVWQDFPDAVWTFLAAILN
ncbi:MAG: hypothetical protein KDA67_07595 [Rhodobacteraceae bacterium]|nr:hypothetical protein [Paracoccaceae bacterium]